MLRGHLQKIVSLHVFDWSSRIFLDNVALHDSSTARWLCGFDNTLRAEVSLQKGPTLKKQMLFNHISHCSFEALCNSL